MNLCVTGSSGYIGRSLLRALRSHNNVDRVVGIDKMSPHLAGLDGDEQIAFSRKDLADSSLSDDWSYLSGVDVMFHLAAARADWGLNYDEYYRDNVLATRAVVQACKTAGIRRVIYFGLPE